MSDKQYGVYPGLLTEPGIKAVKEGTEYELFATIDYLGAFIWRMNHDLCDGRIDSTPGIEKDLVEAQYSIEFAVLQTRRFGVEIPEPKEGEHVARTESYLKWYRWWDNYIKNTLTDEEYEKLRNLISQGKDYSKFRPAGDWKQ